MYIQFLTINLGFIVLGQMLIKIILSIILIAIKTYKDYAS